MQNHSTIRQYIMINFILLRFKPNQITIKKAKSTLGKNWRDNSVGKKLSIPENHQVQNI